MHAGGDEPPLYQFAAGGPMRSAEQRLGVSRGDGLDWLRRAGLVLAIGYLPALGSGVLARALSGEWPELLGCWVTHVRWLAAAPLLLLAEQLTDVRVRGALSYMLGAELIPRCERAGYCASLAAVESLRDSRIAELALAVAALASALASWGTPQLEPTHGWSSLAGLTLFRFLLLRWLWRWLIWALLLLRISRLQLRLSVLHPDQLGGLGPLLGPSYAFCGAVCAGAVAMAAGFADRMAREHVTTESFHPVLLAYIAICYALAAAPLWVFSGQLYGARKLGLRSYGAFATRYCCAFEERWLTRTGTQALGSPDLQSLADLGGSYAIAAGIQVVPLSRRLALGMLAVVLVPMLPLVLTEVRFADLLAAALRAML